MPHTKPMTVAIIYRPPNQSKFLDVFEENLPKRSISYHKFYFLGDFNINPFENGKYVFQKSSSNNKNLDSFTKKYHECCTLFGLKQVIKCPTHVTCHSSSILDHVLASFSDRVSQSGVIDIGISDHQLYIAPGELQELRATAINKLLSVLLKIIHLTFMKRH